MYSNSKETSQVGTSKSKKETNIHTSQARIDEEGMINHTRQASKEESRSVSNCV